MIEKGSRVPEYFTYKGKIAHVKEKETSISREKYLNTVSKFVADEEPKPLRRRSIVLNLSTGPSIVDCSDMSEERFNALVERL